MNAATLPPPERDLTADLMKGSAVLLMIQVHILEVFAQSTVREGLAGQVSLFLGGPPVAPVFLTLLGFFAAKSGLETRRLLKRGGQLFLLGAALNVGMNLHVLWRIHRGWLFLDPREFLCGVDILFAAGFSLWLLAGLRLLCRRNAFAWCVVLAAVIAAAPWLSDRLASESDWKWLTAFVAGRQQWSYFPFFPWAAYPLLGVAVAYSRFVLNRLTLPHFIGLGVLATALCLTGPFAVATSHDLPNYYHHGWRFFLWNVGFLAAWTLLWKLVSNPLSATLGGRWLAWLGRNVTLCYVTQWLLIGNIATAIYQSENLLHCGLWFVTITVAVSWLVYVYRLPARGRVQP